MFRFTLALSVDERAYILLDNWTSCVSMTECSRRCRSSHCRENSTNDPTSLDYPIKYSK
ncbi:hypothetical protein NP493_352g06077 [Ridgeia piscesae]|uniref:Uncharacterized protein n=1 Tax=Ridgeia piscesae TaxID=27915 RepID=A0AAD9L4K0_RIDPI|nr:hypothetical protein NP493_352g06077 [Ridgeia piscesae]